MKKMSAAHFKTHCLAVIDKVQKTKEPISITRRGKPLAMLLPVEEATEIGYLGRLEGLMKTVGDIESPVEPPEAWKILR